MICNVGEVNEPISFKEGRYRQNENVIGCSIRWVHQQVWYRNIEITSSRLSDLFSLLLVPASFVGRDGACPDHNYACISLPDRPSPQTPQPYSLYPRLCFSSSPIKSTRLCDADCLSIIKKSVDIVDMWLQVTQQYVTLQVRGFNLVAWCDIKQSSRAQIASSSTLAFSSELNLPVLDFVGFWPALCTSPQCILFLKI